MLLLLPYYWVTLAVLLLDSPFFPPPACSPNLTNLYKEDWHTQKSALSLVILLVLVFPSATTNVDFLTLLVSLRVPACFPLSVLFTTHSFSLCLNAKLLYPLLLQQLFCLCKPQGVLWLELYFPAQTSASVFCLHNLPSKGFLDANHCCTSQWCSSTAFLDSAAALVLSGVSFSVSCCLCLPLPLLQSLLGPHKYPLPNFRTFFFFFFEGIKGLFLWRFPPLPVVPVSG